MVAMPWSSIFHRRHPLKSSIDVGVDIVTSEADEEDNVHLGLGLELYGSKLVVADT